MRGYSRIIILILLFALVGTVLAAPSGQSNLFEKFTLDTRHDLELLATDVLGDSRPDGWTGNDQPGSGTFVADLWFDNELLATELYGPTLRPPGWIGATSPNAELIARNVRHDLELSADFHYGENQRPDNWTGASKIYRCSRVLQDIVYLLGTVNNVYPRTPESSIDYCGALSAEVDDTLVPNTLENTAFISHLPDLLLAIRGDLERLADEDLGLNNRPPGWIGNRDENSPTFIGDVFLDLSNLADNQLGVDQRPPDWIGAVTNSAPVSYRNLRHDLELLADITRGVNSRPTGWQGEDPVTRCDIDTQNLVVLVQQRFDLPIDVGDQTPEEFCPAIAVQAENLTENPPVELASQAEDTRFMAESRRAFAYLDVAALDYMGVMPYGTVFHAWYRNFNNSTMMFVSGDNFALFVDRRWTTLDENVFRLLPTLEGVKPLTFCDATWCNGPGPTPTPTGSGPLLNIINAATPPATIPPESVSQTGKTQVSWNQIRVNYLLQRPDVGAAQVTLEICQDVSQIACEPVRSVFDNNTGTAYPVISQYNGQNVYEFKYGYTSNLLIEGDNLFSTDIWINDPTLLTPTGQ